MCLPLYQMVVDNLNLNFLTRFHKLTRKVHSRKLAWCVNVSVGPPAVGSKWLLIKDTDFISESRQKLFTAVLPDFEEKKT